MAIYQQSNPVSTLREILFRLSTGSGVLPSQTFSGSEIQVRKAGGALANAANSGSVTELGSTGVYVYTASIGELDTPGLLLLRVVKSGALVWEETHQIDRAVFGTAVTGTLTTTSFTTSLTTPTADHWKDSWIRFVTGSLAGQVKRIGAYAVTGGLITLANNYAFTGVAANGDVFQIEND